MNKSNIVLIGMPGSGKSTVGVVLAKAMGLSFVDVDLEICRIHGGSLQQIVNRFSHEDFLRIESEAALSLRCRDSVIATGGSMVYSEAAMRHLKENGIAVYLKAELSEIEKRICNLETRGIAFLPGETLTDLYVGRTPLYEKWADITVPSLGGDRIETVALKIRNELMKSETDFR